MTRQSHELCVWGSWVLCPGCSEVLLAGEQSSRAAPGANKSVSELCISYCLPRGEKEFTSFWSLLHLKGNTKFWAILLNKLLNLTGALLTSTNAVDSMKPVGIWFFFPPCWCFLFVCVCLLNISMTLDNIPQLSASPLFDLFYQDTETLVRAWCYAN